jgi:hypothetical protein
MKFYETHYEDYISSIDRINIHPELTEVFNTFPKKIYNLKNLIFYGPSGVGKYSQILYLLKRYSPSELKYDKKITAVTEKQQYIYRISDIHYEVDMSLLGCNSKMLWHEIFFQIVDIISVKQDKIGIIVCKNFHLIHTELLEIFYSYIQQYNFNESTIKIKFIIMTEHVSFLPEQIINCSQIIKVKRPSKELYLKEIMYSKSMQNENAEENSNFIKKITYDKNKWTFNIQSFEKSKQIFENIDVNHIVNSKEIKSFELIDNVKSLPKDTFNIICDNIIEEIVNKNPLVFTNFRDTLYDILTYNLDVTECLWYIIHYLVTNDYLSENDTSDILDKTFTFLKYYNNNYRPIYHLESIMFYIINKIHHYNEL